MCSLSQVIIKMIRCRLAYGPADATASHCLAGVNEYWFYLLVPAYPGSPRQRAIKQELSFQMRRFFPTPIICLQVFWCFSKVYWIFLHINAFCLSLSSESCNFFVGADNFAVEWVKLRWIGVWGNKVRNHHSSDIHATGRSSCCSWLYEICEIQMRCGQLQHCVFHACLETTSPPSSNVRWYVVKPIGW